MEDMSKTNATLCLSEVVPSGDRHLYFRCVYRHPNEKGGKLHMFRLLREASPKRRLKLLGPEFLRLFELDPEF
jgi:hypothetical protein